MSYAGSGDLPVPLEHFAATLRPRTDPATRPGQRARLLPGEPDEVWLRLLSIRHRSERHTHAEWRSLIDRYRREPAHPSDPRYARN